jgi:outer membrane receptor protein involved in Fe transport
MRILPPLFLLGVFLTAPIAAAADEPVPSPSPSPSPTPEPKAEHPEQSGGVEDVVVSASARTEALLDAPAAVTVISGKELETNPGDQLVDHLRRVPGINVVQFSARDVNIASRSATGGINTSTLVLVDGRNLYLDFLGFVMWEFAPTDPSLIDRVEVVRGPASSIWGANASGGVVHVLTKSPFDTLGGAARIDVGNYGARRIEARESFLAGAWALRLSAGYFESDAFPRPKTITNLWGETVNPDLGLLPQAVGTSGTRQPRFDLRADRDDASGGTWMVEAGTGKTAGWIATGLGPFQVNSDTSMSYASMRWHRGAFEAQANTNYFSGDAVNLINALPFQFKSGATQVTLRGAAPIANRGVVGWGGSAELSTYDLSIAPAATHRTKLGVYADADVEIVPKFSIVAGARLDDFKETVGTEFSPRLALRWKPRPDQTLRVAAGRAYRSPSVIESDLDVPSIPVAKLNWHDVDQQLIAQGVIDPTQFPNGLFELLALGVCGTRPDNCGAPPGQAPVYVAVTGARGSHGLSAEETTSVELGWAGRFRAFEVSATVYRNWTKGGIDFPVKTYYGLGPDRLPGTADDVVLPSDPNHDGIQEAPPVDLCPYGIGQFAVFAPLCDDPARPSPKVPYNLALSVLLDGRIPALFQYQNTGTVQNDGVELGVSWAGQNGVSASFNYSWQSDPISAGIAMSDRIDTARQEHATGLTPDTTDFVNIPARHRVSLSGSIDRGRWFTAASWDYITGTFWQDVLTSDYWGFVPGYHLVGVRGGWRWPKQGLQLTAQITNLLNTPIQQHIYGDVMERRATLGLSFAWPGPSQPAHE